MAHFSIFTEYGRAAAGNVLGLGMHDEGSVRFVENHRGLPGNRETLALSAMLLLLHRSTHPSLEVKSGSYPTTGKMRPESAPGPMPRRRGPRGATAERIPGRMSLRPETG